MGPSRICTKCERLVGEHGALGLCSKHYKAKLRSEGTVHKYNQKYLKAWIRSPSGRWSALKRAVKLSKSYSDITREQHAYLLEKLCHYCNERLNPTGHGLDKKDSQRSYTLDNVVPCCDQCNSIKNAILTYEEMKVAMTAVLNYRKEKNGA